MHRERPVSSRHGARMTPRVADSRELTGWVLSFGRGVRVIKPAVLRERVGQEVPARASLWGRDDRQPEPSKVIVEREAGHALEQGRDHDERDRVAEREAVISTMPAKDLL